MDIGLSETQQLIRNSAREFLEENCDTQYVRAMEEDEVGHTEELWDQIAELGWLGLTVPEEYGGAGMTFSELAVLLEETGAAMLPGPFFSTAVIGAEALKLAGSDEQKTELLAKLATGKLKMALAFHEKAAAWAPESVSEMTATQTDDGWILNGEKRFVQDGAASDMLIVAARTGEDPKSGITLFLVENDNSNVESRELKTTGSDRMSVMSFGEVSVPKSAVLGEVNGGWPILEKLFQYGAAGKCAEMAGAGQKLLDNTVDYVQNRVQFGRPIGSFQAIQHHAADMAIEVQAGRQLARQAAWFLGEGLDATRQVALAKAYLSEAYPRICATAHQCHGAIGFTHEYDLHLWTRRSTGQRLAFGDTKLHQETLARSVGL
ncbi:MAG: acyl-CoA/acyl-ACP dehydrogenase [Chloroflexi bacterium]|nr:acyl-CoA/acyl-ACP dehydrogenase [Chloroflexota bacterium]MCH8235605.1 acyl-CoA/acyl-ACP dehydrogenase [Chloroflexota bacterium]